MSELSLFLDEDLQTDFLFSAEVGVHASTCIAVIPISSRESIGMQEESWSNHTEVPSANFILGFLAIFPTNG